MKKVIVLGGYGNFGKKIVEHLLDMTTLIIVIAGRNKTKAQACVDELSIISQAQLVPLAIDIYASDFAIQLQELVPDLVIHTSGPYQQQDYLVARACINAGAHYIDLADDRRFVCDIVELEQLAKQQGVLVVSGASSVPGLSSAVIDQYRQQFSSLTHVEMAIAPGNKATRGTATVKSILSYTGHPFSVFSQGKQQSVYGWMSAKKQDFGDIVGKRWLANVDVPDLELFPSRYQVKDTVSFQAGLELPILHLTMVAMAYLVKKRVVRNWSPLTDLVVKASNLFLPFGSANGAMQIKLSGLDHQQQKKTITWSLYAPKGIGPYIPTLSTIIVAKKLLDPSIKLTGASPCVDLFTLADFSPYFEKLAIYQQEKTL